MGDIEEIVGGVEDVCVGDDVTQTLCTCLKLLKNN